MEILHIYTERFGAVSILLPWGTIGLCLLAQTIAGFMGFILAICKKD